MPRPPQNVRIARLAAVLALDDTVRKSGAVPDIATVRSALGLSKHSAGAVRYHIAWRHGLTPPPTPAAPCVRLSSEFPPMPDGLTLAQQACFFALATATKPLSAATMYARAFNYPFDEAASNLGRVHISHMRRRGVAIDSRHGVGYWLAAKRIEGEPPYLEPMAHHEAMEVSR